MSAEMTVLSNGLRVVTDINKAVDTVALAVCIGSGSRNESLELNGISHLLEHMVFKGTRNRNAYQIAMEMDDIGGHLNAYTSRDHTAFYAKVLKRDIRLSVDILSDIFLNPQLDESEFLKEKEVVIQEIHQSFDTPEDIVYDYLQSTAYPNQAIGYPILGTLDSVRSIKVHDLKKYLEIFYVSSNTIISCSGNFEKDDFIDLLESYFHETKLGKSVEVAPVEYIGGNNRVSKKIEQLQIALGFNGYNVHHPDFYSLAALSVILGEGMSSRLFQEVRERHALAYSVFSSVSAQDNSSLLSVYAGTTPDNSNQLIKILCKEISAISSNLKLEEIKRAKAQLKSSLLMSLESVDGRCIHYARQVLLFGKLLGNNEILSKIDDVCIKSIERASQQVFSSKPTLSVVGDSGNVPDYSEITDSIFC